MTALPTAWLPALLAAVGAASPLLASWTATLEAGGGWRWWQPGNVTPARCLGLGAVAVGLTVASTAAGGPWLAWTAFAVGGAVLMTVDAQTHLLPARFLYPLTGIIGVVFIGAAAGAGEEHALVRSVLAGLVVGLIWLVVALVAPAALGLGDVRLFALSAAMLGWLSWPAVLTGQFLTFLLAPIAALALLAFRRGRATKVVNVPMGPSSVFATILVGWLMHA